MAYSSRPTVPRRKKIMAEDSTYVNPDYYSKTAGPYRPHKETDFPKQFGNDITRGFEEAKHLVTTAVERVKEGFRKVKKHLGGK